MAIEVGNQVQVTINRHSRYQEVGLVLNVIRRGHPNFSRAEVEFADGQIIQIEIRGLERVSQGDDSGE